MQGYQFRRRLCLGLGLCAVAAAGTAGCKNSPPIFGYKSDAHAIVQRYPLEAGQTLAMDDQSLRRFEDQYRETYTRSLGPGVDVQARVIHLSGKKFIYAVIGLNGSHGGAALLQPEGHEVVKVTCLSGGKADAKFKDSACGPVAEKTFGVSLSSSDEDF